MRRKIVVVVSGPVAGGKSTLARELANRFGGRRLSTRELLVRHISEDQPATRTLLQKIGQERDLATNGSWVAEGFSRAVLDANEDLVIIDSARRIEQVHALRVAFGRDVRHVHITAPREICSQRHEERRVRSDNTETTYEEVCADSTESRIEDLADHADVVIDTNRHGAEDVVIRVAARLGLLDVEHGRCVDVLVGGLYGSEGKGNIAFYLAPEYDLLIRVGGPNAAHTVYLPSEEKFIHYSLPSGTQAGARRAQILLGAGALVYLDELFDEISRSEISASRLSIDPQVMIIESADKTEEAELRKRIGSTASGTGAATARRMLRHENVRLARDVPELAPFIRRGTDVLEQAYRSHSRIFLEGTQGAGLSLYHGPYPFTTSRDTNVAACLSEAGIAPARVRRSIMVVRSYPIRVGGTSGPLRREIDWRTVEQRAGLIDARLEEKELTSKTRTKRRVGEFEWDLLRRSSLINAPTDIALTFADYIDAGNADAWRYEQLTERTLLFIDDLERVSGARVSLISTGFMPRRGIIDRRAW